jgi:hypothetical protein
MPSAVAGLTLSETSQGFEPDRELRQALKRSLMYHSFVGSRVKARTIRLHLSHPDKYSAEDIRRGLDWLKNRVADADLITSCKREHVAEHVHERVLRFMLIHTDESDHEMLKKLSTKLRMSIMSGIADAELGGAFFGF